MKTNSLFLRKHSQLIHFCLAFLIILAFNFIVQVGVSPGVSGMSTDSGVFAYCGQQILHGSLLYRDCWDNKPPAIYYLNALAVAIGGNTTGSIWFFQAVWITFTGLAFYFVLYAIWRSRLAALVTFFFLATVLYPRYYQGGNLTETYVLLLFILQIGMFYQFLSSGKGRFLAGIGVLAALACLLKPTYLGITLGIIITILYLDLRRRSLRALLGHVLILLLSILLPLGLVAGYWAVQGSFNDFWFAIFLHNLTYTQAGFSKHSLIVSFQMYFITSPMAVVASLAMLSSVVFLYEHWRKILPLKISGRDPHDLTAGMMKQDSARRWLMLSLLISIPIDFALFALSGKNFGHYLLVPLPALSIVSLVALDVLNRFLQVQKVDQQNSNAKSVFIFALAALIFLYAIWFYKIAAAEIPKPGKLTAFLKHPNVFSRQYTELEQYILENAQLSDTVLAWSSDPSLNFITGRRSPTRYIFPLHLLTPTLTDSNGFDELIAELQKAPPAVIAAQPKPASAMPFFDAGEQDFCLDCSAEVKAGLLRLKTYLLSHYRFDRQLWDWYLYVPIR